MIYLHKILPAFVLPVSLIICLIVAGLVSRRSGLIWAGVVALWIASTPIVGRFAVRAMEGDAVRGTAAAAPAADAIVVLSGGRIIAPGSPPVSEWQDADRFYAGVELFKAGKAPRLMFTGGWVPWLPQAPLEGDVLKTHALALGVPADSITTTPPVSNTEEEARATAAALNTGDGSTSRILLVTSAFHMSRARQLFEAAGMQVTAFPVDFATSSGWQFTVMDVLPTADALAFTQVALREAYGRVYYRVRSVVTGT